MFAKLHDTWEQLEHGKLNTSKNWKHLQVGYQPQPDMWKVNLPPPERTTQQESLGPEDKNYDW